MDELSALLHGARRLPRHGAALRGPDPPRQGHERARRAGAQGRPHVGRAARRRARGRRRVAPRAAHEAGRRGGDGGARAREVEHAQEAGPGRRAQAYAPPKLSRNRLPPARAAPDARTPEPKRPAARSEPAVDERRAGARATPPAGRRPEEPADSGRESPAAGDVSAEPSRAIARCPRRGGPDAPRPGFGARRRRRCDGRLAPRLSTSATPRIRTPQRLRASDRE